MNTIDEFELFDLKVEVIATEKAMVCSHKAGEYFEVIGENILFNQTKSFSLYALAALFPLLPAKQRKTTPNDWMSTDMDIACPDPNCGAIFRISRQRIHIFKHSDVTVTPLKGEYE